MANSTRTKVLFLDDQLDLVQVYVRELQNAGFDVRLASSSQEVRQIFLSEAIDLAILDVNLLPSTEIEKIKNAQRQVGDEPFVPEEGEGFRVAQWLKDRFPSTGVVILSSERIEPADKITGLDFGADDYIVKGMLPQEFLSRINALARRLLPPQKSVNIGQLSLNLDQQVLTNQTGRSTHVTEAEKRLLIALSERPWRSKSRAELYHEVFGSGIPSPKDRAVDNLVSKVRQKVRDDLLEVLPVETIYGGGYVLRP